MSTLLPDLVPAFWTCLAAYVEDSGLIRLVMCGSPSLTNNLTRGAHVLHLETNRFHSPFVSVSQLLNVLPLFQTVTGLSIKADLKTAFFQSPVSLELLRNPIQIGSAAPSAAPSALSSYGHLLTSFECEFPRSIREILAVDQRLDLTFPNLKVLRLIDTYDGSGKTHPVQRIAFLPRRLEELYLERRGMHRHAGYETLDLIRHLPSDTLRVLSISGYICQATDIGKVTLTEDKEALNSQSTLFPSSGAESTYTFNVTPHHDSLCFLGFEHLPHLTRLKIDLGRTLELDLTRLPSSLKHIELVYPTNFPENLALREAPHPYDKWRSQIYGTAISNFNWSDRFPALETLKYITGETTSVSWRVLERLPKTVLHFDMRLSSDANAKSAADALEAAGPRPKGELPYSLPLPPPSNLSASEIQEFSNAVSDLAARAITLSIYCNGIERRKCLPTPTTSPSELKGQLRVLNLETFDLSPDVFSAVTSHLDKLWINQLQEPERLPKRLKELTMGALATPQFSSVSILPSSLTKLVCENRQLKSYEIQVLPLTLTDLTANIFDVFAWAALRDICGDPEPIDPKEAKKLEKDKKKKKSSKANASVPEMEAPKVVTPVSSNMKLRRLKTAYLYGEFKSGSYDNNPLTCLKMSSADLIPRCVQIFETSYTMCDEKEDLWYTNLERHPSLTSLTYEFKESLDFLGHLPPQLTELKLQGWYTYDLVGDETLSISPSANWHSRFPIGTEMAGRLPRALRVLDLSECCPEKGCETAEALAMSGAQSRATFVSFTNEAAARLPPFLSRLALPYTPLYSRAYEPDPQAFKRPDSNTWSFVSSAPTGLVYIDWLPHANAQDWETFVTQRWAEREIAYERTVEGFKAYMASADTKHSKKDENCAIQ